MHVSQHELALSETLEICDREVTLRRSLENLSRVEAVVGAAAPFALRLEARAVSQREIVRVYAALLRGAIDEPAQRDLEAWVFKRGSGHPHLAAFVFSLSMGSDELDAAVKARNLAVENPKSKGVDAEANRPFATTAASTGPSSSGSDTVLATLRARLLQPLSLN